VEATAAAERQAEQRVREARAAGFREGEAAGRKRAAAELEPVLERLARSIQEMAGLRGQMRREAEADMLRLALEIARRVLRREMAADPDAMRGLVLAALEKLQGQEISRVKVHPSHAALVTELLRKHGTAQPVEVIADASREPGAAVFETERGNLDASVDAQLREIERGLTDCLRRRA
jgi:flagellar assembly protein FliH